MPLLDRLRWLRGRLASMSPAEVAHRAREQALRRGGRRATPPATADGALPVLPGLRDGLLDLGRDERLLADWREVFERARTRRFRLLGLDWPDALPADGFWHRDPVSGRLWPRDAYCFDVAYRHADGMGDVKYVWEVNRLQHLQPIAALATATSDEAPAAFVLAEIEGWLAVNPPYKGVNWNSGIELALRVVSLVVTVSLLGAERVPPRLRADLRASLAAHGFWLMRFPSLHSSANNHRVAELAGLYLLGALTPDLPGAAAWRAEGRDGLIAEADRQFRPDGVGAEQSPTYAALTLEWLMLAALVGERLGEPFPHVVGARIERAGEAFRAITDASGHQPRIGDDDDSAVLYSGGEPGGFVTSLLASVAASRGRPDLAPPGIRPHLRGAAFGRPPAPAPAPEGVAHFPEGGLTAVRERVGGVEALWVLDHGPLGYLSIAAHGHADALALWLHVDGRPVLADAGTYLYHAGGDWRTAFRATAAHNTLELDGRSSSVMTGPFNWGERARCVVREVVTAPEAWAIEAEHDGYRKPLGLVHRRRLARAPGGAVLTDALIGDGAARRARLAFHVHPSLRIEAEGPAWRVLDAEGRAPLTIAHDGPLAGRVETFWYSPEFGRKTEARRLVLEGALAPGVVCRTRLRVSPAGAGEPVARV